MYTYRVLVWWSEGKRSYAGPRHKWKGSINMGRKERGCEAVDWILLTYDSKSGGLL